MLHIPSDSSVHRIDVRSKLIVLLVYSIGLFFVQSWVGMIVYSAFFIFVLVVSKIPFSRIFFAAIPIYFIVVITVVCNALSVPYEIINLDMILSGEAYVVYAAFLKGCMTGLRILLLSWMSILFCYTTTSTQIMGAFAWFLGPLSRKTHLADDLAMIFSIAIRFMPAIALEFQSIRDAQWSRGAHFNEGNIFRRIKSYCMILMPVIIGLFRKAERLSKSMDARCYGLLNVTRTYQCISRWHVSDMIYAVIISAVLIAVIWLV